MTTDTEQDVHPTVAAVVAATTVREVRDAQARQAQELTDVAFLDAVIRPYVALRVAGDAGWDTEVIQLDGTGAFTVRLTLGDAPPLFAKSFLDDSGREVFAKLREIRRAGFGSGSRYQAVEPLAWFSDRRLLLSRGAPGRAVSDLVGGDDAELIAGVREAGSWLGALHSSRLRIGRPKSLLVTGELVSLADRLAKTVNEHPAYLPVAHEMLDMLDRLSVETVDGLLMQSHGQYRPIHVFVSGEPDAPDRTVTVIDLDRSSPADPGRDLAEFLHRLRIAMHRATGSTDRADRPCRAFLDAYRQRVGTDDYLANLRFHWARYIFHSLTRKVKIGRADPVGGSGLYPLYRSEFDRVMQAGDLV